jgi:hypothetical protein
MKKFLMLPLMLVILLQVAPASAWSVTTHYEIADETYSSLSPSVQSNLSEIAMRDGADDPDVKFRDFQYHHMPYSAIKAQYWLNKGKLNYDDGNYRYASYCFGVASHYISDSFCAPHTVNGASKVDHTLYEVQAIFLEPHATYEGGDLNTLLHQGQAEGEVSWTNWNQDHSDAVIQNNLNDAAGATYTLISEYAT